MTETVDINRRPDGEWVMNFKLINEAFISRVPDMSQIFQLLRLQNQILSL